VHEHLAHRSSWFADLAGPLVVADTALGAYARAVPEEHRSAGAELDVAVLTTGGAGSVSALAGRRLPGLHVVAAEAALRDLDNLAGNAARVAAAANDLGEVEVEVTLPDAPGWVRAVEVVEAAGLWAHVLAPIDAWRDAGAAVRLAERLSVLVEADLAFSVTPEGTGELSEPGRSVTVLAMLVEALVDGAEPAEAAELLVRTDAGRVRAGLDRWDGATVARVRRRVRGVTCDPRSVAEDLAAMGLLPAARTATA